MKLFKKMRKDNNGFTLVEIMIVVMILGILASAVVINISKTTQNSVIQSCKTDWRIVDNAMRAFYNDNPNSNPSKISNTSPLYPFTHEDFYSTPISGDLRDLGYMTSLIAISQVNNTYKIGLFLYDASGTSAPSYQVVVNDYAVTKRYGSTGTSDDCNLIYG